MTVTAFEGPAGSGKTHRLMEEVAAALRRQPLRAHERVIALSYMHGARRRLEQRLRAMEELRGRFEALTLDSFAWRLTQRWCRLLLHLGRTMPVEEEYGPTCRLAAALLEKQIVRDWIALSFPIIVIDEAQDFDTDRSLLIAALARGSAMFLAFDEFQCLNTAQLPIAIEGWLRDFCEPVALTGNFRTDDGELIAAAVAVREGRAPPKNGRRFKIEVTPGQPALAATFIANAITWRAGGDVAVVTPSRQGKFAEAAIAAVRAGPVGKYRSGPHPIVWEASDDQDCDAFWAQLPISERLTIEAALEALARHRDIPAVRSVSEWLICQRSALGRRELAAEELRGRLSRTMALRRRYGGRRQAAMLAMTIQQAKNREFDHVIVLWPFTVRNDGEQRRRLLYNAITRAKRSCLVLVQARELLNAPPFQAKP